MKFNEWLQEEHPDFVLDEERLEYCFKCGEPTGHAGAGDGSIYCGCDAGPFCDDCWKLHNCTEKEQE